MNETLIFIYLFIYFFLHLASRTGNPGWGSRAPLPRQTHPVPSSEGRQGGADEARARRVRPGVNFRRALRVGA